jgi:hypothetical protein
MFVMQTYISLIAIGVINNISFIRSVLTTGRVARLVLAAIGLVQLVRSELSYYHLVAVSRLYHLVCIPDYFMVFQELFLGSGRFNTILDQTLKCRRPFHGRVSKYIPSESNPYGSGNGKSLYRLGPFDRDIQIVDVQNASFSIIQPVIGHSALWYWSPKRSHHMLLHLA